MRSRIRKKRAVLVLLPFTRDGDPQVKQQASEGDFQLTFADDDQALQGIRGRLRDCFERVRPCSSFYPRPLSSPVVLTVAFVSWCIRQSYSLARQPGANSRMPGRTRLDYLRSRWKRTEKLSTTSSSSFIPIQYLHERWSSLEISP